MITHRRHGTRTNGQLPSTHRPDAVREHQPAGLGLDRRAAVAGLHQAPGPRPDVQHRGVRPDQAVFHPAVLVRRHRPQNPLGQLRALVEGLAVLAGQEAVHVGNGLVGSVQDAQLRRQRAESAFVVCFAEPGRQPPHQERRDLVVLFGAAERLGQQRAGVAVGVRETAGGVRRRRVETDGAVARHQIVLGQTDREDSPVIA
jgi:hypothetical protein